MKCPVCGFSQWSWLYKNKECEFVGCDRCLTVIFEDDEYEEEDD
jgi:ssDNA-binding Zn-finger/Zn-ribbon topoisomerase 1